MLSIILSSSRDRIILKVPLDLSCWYQSIGIFKVDKYFKKYLRILSSQYLLALFDLWLRNKSVNNNGTASEKNDVNSLNNDLVEQKPTSYLKDLSEKLLKRVSINNTSTKNKKSFKANKSHKQPTASDHDGS